ncbi:hypothetical protein BDV96DRAFT_508657 [Lophiotrema nucula]|uniref:Uncharacterized protein n=1 Tax=Lophiotrema nucula TaxID=690887 RepID=A0A6A5YFK0_9PLEO|nr:hypothetical protein BDV96DRAFT_508657 [Lophiotrema nucula]
MTWFGSLDLAYKYGLVFGLLLVLTISAGVIKVFIDRRKIKLAAAKENVEAGRKEDHLELNQREKDEGDLFGIRAIEAGFFAGIPQSRPTSRAGSIAESTKGTPSISTNTLIGSLASPKIQTHSAMSSVTSLPLAHMSDRNRDSETLADSPPRRKSPPAIKLRPSEAELNGRINHNASVNMNLAVPPSPVLARAPSSPAFGSSDADSDGAATPRSLSPRSANFTPDHYAPVPPQIPIPEGLRAALHSPELIAKSQSASLNDHSPGQSPGNSAPPSPSYPPESRVPSMPAKVLREEPRSLFPAYSERRRPSLPKVEVRQAGPEQSSR